MIVNNNEPVYSFLGYRLLQAMYIRTNDNPLETFGVKIMDSKLKENNIHLITVQFNMKFQGCEDSIFIFNAGFKINDHKWYTDMGNLRIDALFFSVLFPFIREKIFSLSSDYRKYIDIPILDLRNVNLSEGIEFSRK